MTEAPTIEDERAARLARLRERREPDAGAGQPTAPEPPPTARPAAPPASPNPVAASSRRRRSPATNAKIVTVGASATAMFGMIAGYGIADGMTTDEPVGAPASVADMTAVPAPAPAPILPASPTVTPPADQPQVIVVVVDGATGRTLSTSNGTGDLAIDLTAAGIPPAVGSTPDATTPTPPAPATPTPTSAPTPGPVAAPAAVDLAVPAPPPPPAAPRAAPAPAPQPQATSSGS